jgi:hypothetical protein
MLDEFATAGLPTCLYVLHHCATTNDVDAFDTIADGDSLVCHGNGPFHRLKSVKPNT